MRLKKTLLFLGLSFFTSPNLFAHSANSVLGNLHIHSSDIIALAIIIFLLSGKSLMILISNKFFREGE